MTERHVGPDEPSVRSAPDLHRPGACAWPPAGSDISVLMSDPELQRLAGLIRQEEFRVGRDLRDELQVFQDRRDYALLLADFAVLSRNCSAKHGRWGGICVLTAGHENTAPHWGVTSQGAIAWLGTAPDDPEPGPSVPCTVA
ncbi:hypothetical protein [Streptomyces xiamenensis]|uniref:hypothetical protein n=1 Tax=Streptomyces xiamenensis TaxID=408015 RepID=UPI0035D61BBC